MPPRKKTKAPTPKKANAKTTTKMSVSQVQKFNVRVGGDGGGSMPALIVYVMYTPRSPTQSTHFVLDNGLPPAPVTREPAPHSSSPTEISISHKYPSHPRSHQHLSPPQSISF